jgi:AAA15 family ATPase/GTPase
MLIRFSVNNVFSFGEEKEFNMLPALQIEGTSEHKYNKNGFDILKLVSIHGTNAAGKETKGQLIFTTHESNLLGQDVFRKDEIWFAEKDKAGNTDLYALSNFKEHTVLDLRKGYLTGRYGAIPFLRKFTGLKLA